MSAVQNSDTAGMRASMNPQDILSLIQNSTSASQPMVSVMSYWDLGFSGSDPQRPEGIEDRQYASANIPDYSTPHTGQSQ